MIHPDTMLADFGPPLGKGVIATRPIARGTFTYIRDALDVTLSPQAWEALPELLREHSDTYAWCDESGSRVVGWDLSKYVNHHCDANTMSTPYGCEVAVRDIAIGEQLTAEYGLLRILYEYEVGCGCTNCRGAIRFSDRRNFGMRWDALIQAALRESLKVPQPLSSLLPDAERLALEAAVAARQPWRSVLAP
jgi:hypothetical protein